MRLLLFVVSVALLGCAGASSTPAPCICNKNYEPVCGTDGITYGNPCQLDCSGVALDHHGRCQTPCVCPRNWDPHCGLNGVTYANLCMLDCSGTTLLHDGPCHVAKRAAPLCPCPFIYLPVCGDDGITYGNQCALECGHTVHKVSDGPCPPTETTTATP